MGACSVCGCACSVCVVHVVCVGADVHVVWVHVVCVDVHVHVV